MAKSVFDAVVATAKMEIREPDGTPTGVFLTIQGLGVATVKQKALEANAFIMQAGKADKTEELVKHMLKAEKAAAEMASLAVVGWSDDEYFQGPYTPDYAKEVFSNPRMDWLRSQVNSFVAEQSNFFRAQPTVAPASPDLAA